MYRSSPARPVRIDVSIEAMLTTADGVEVKALVRDLSAGGFRVSLLSAEELLVGERVTLVVAGGETLAGEIRWAAGREAGGSFVAAG